MRHEVEKLPADHAGHFIDRVREQDGAVEDGQFRTVFGKEFAVEINRAFHVSSFQRNRLRTIPMARRTCAGAVPPVWSRLAIDPSTVSTS